MLTRTVMERLPPTPHLNNRLFFSMRISNNGSIIVSHWITNRIFKAGNEELAILLDMVYGYDCSNILISDIFVFKNTEIYEAQALKI